MTVVLDSGLRRNDEVSAIRNAMAVPGRQSVARRDCFASLAMTAGFGMVGVAGTMDPRIESEGDGFWERAIKAQSSCSDLIRASMGRFTHLEPEVRQLSELS